VYRSRIDYEQMLLYPLFHVLDEPMEKKSGDGISSYGMNGAAVIKEVEWRFLSDCIKEKMNIVTIWYDFFGNKYCVM
jgi:hypothetical protein